MEIFDYCKKTINYNGKIYPFRYLWHEEYKCTVLIATNELNKDLFEKNGLYKDKIGEFIDEQIIYFFNENELNRPVEYFQKILNEF